MRIVLVRRKRRYVSGVSILMFVMTLAMAVVGCDGGIGESYTLTLHSTDGGAVTIPGEGNFTYDEGRVVNLVATADEGYEFQGWTGDTEDVADPGSRTTTIIMSQYSSITANFRPTDSHGPSIP